MIESVIFWVFATLSIVGALGVVLHRSIIYSALMLILVFMSIAGFFILNNADFLAIAQIIVYAVGLTIILLFGVMFTGDRPFKDQAVPKGQILAFFIVSAFTCALLIRGVLFPYNQQAPSGLTIDIYKTEGSTGMLGALLFQNYALPFELASILLLVAMIGAIVLAKKKFTTAEEMLGKTKLPLNVTSAPRVAPAVPAQGGFPQTVGKKAAGETADTVESGDVPEAVGVK